jgi:Ca-activated chloride channel family protein
MNLLQVQHPSNAILFGIPLLAAFLAILGFSRSQKNFLSLTGPSESLERQFFHRYVLREGTFVLSLLSIVLASLGITWGTVPVEEDRTGLDVVFVLDISRSMLARDVSPSRLEYAKTVALSLLDTLADARFSVVIYKGTAIRAIPLTEDREVLENFLRNVTPSFLQSKGTNLSLGLQEATKCFPPESGRHGVVILLSDGETQEPMSSSVLGVYRKQGIPVFSVGIGTVEGTVIPDPTPIRGKDGKVVVSKLNRSLLQKVAGDTGGVYLEVGNLLVNRVLWEELMKFRTDRERVRVRMVGAERHDLFLLLALIFLLIHIGVRVLPWKLETWKLEKGQLFSSWFS